jgi:type I restriction enzyme M protein
MFFTVTLPATLWFFDKQKVKTDRKDKILFIDARNVFYQIDRAHREWTEEQQQNLAAIVRLHRNETDRYLELIHKYILKADEALAKLPALKASLTKQVTDLEKSLKTYVDKTKSEKRTPAKKKALLEANFFERLKTYNRNEAKANKVELVSLNHSVSETIQENEAQHKAAAHLNWHVTQSQNELGAIKKGVDNLTELWKVADQNLKLKTDKVWSENGLMRADKVLEESISVFTGAVEQFSYWFENIEWLQTRFPEAKYRDVVGLCKMAS